MSIKKEPRSIFGVVPPPNTLKYTSVERYAKRLADTYRELEPDAMILYDIQEEKGRNGKERPFPFRTRFSPLAFHDLLFKALPEDAVLILYQTLTVDKPLSNLSEYIQECWEKHHIQYLVWVGASKDISVMDASRLTKQHCPEMILGGITIPERHRDRHDEDQRVLDKINSGVDFFTSQIVYNADNVITFLKDYWKMCQTNAISPRTIVLAFAPFGRQDTLDFMRWLGVEISDGTANRVLSRDDVHRRIDESIEICLEIFTTVQAMCTRNNIDIPLGITVESVSKYKDEQKGASTLFVLLKKELSV